MTRQIRSAYEDLERHPTVPRGESMTKQSFKDSCEINNILAKYNKTGVIEHVNQHSGDYKFATSLSFTEAQQMVAKAQSMFNELPAQARARFENDPAKFLAHFENYENTEEAANELFELGIGYQPDPNDFPENLPKPEVDEVPPESGEEPPA